MVAPDAFRCSPDLCKFLIAIPRTYAGGSVEVELERGGTSGAARTALTISVPDRGTRCFRIARPAHEVTDADLAPARRFLERRSRLAGWGARAAGLAGWWLGFTGLFAMGSICPCCGRADCVLGIGVAGTFGAIATLTLSKLKSLFGRNRSQADAAPVQRMPGRGWRLAGFAVVAAMLGVLAVAWLRPTASGDNADRAQFVESSVEATGQPGASGSQAPAPIALDFAAFRDVRLPNQNGVRELHLPWAVKDALGKRVRLRGIGFYYLAGMHGDRVCGFLLMPSFAVASGAASVPDDQPQWTILVECSRTSWARLTDYPRPVRAEVEGTLTFSGPNLNGCVFAIQAARIRVQPLGANGLSSDEGGPPCPRCGVRHALESAPGAGCCEGCRSP
jgi:hypothetical protein